MLLVLATVGVAAIAGAIGFFVTGELRDAALGVGACLLAAAVAWLTLRCVQAFDVRFAVTIFVLSLPTTAPMRMAAIAALREVNPYILDVINVRYVGLTADGLATFRLPASNPLYGDAVSVAIAGIVLPRAKSSDACEVAMARTADSLIADTLARAQRIDLQEIRLLHDGEYVAGVSRDGWLLHNLLQKRLPMIAVESDAMRNASATTDWCNWSARGADDYR